MVLYPRLGFDCPILAMDMVAANGQVGTTCCCPLLPSACLHHGGT
jgi:hypothetical protein